MLDLNLLHIVVALHEERNVSRAAERLGVSQSALSGALARLRDALGDPLFIRSGGEMLPTEKGASILAPIRCMLALVRDDILAEGRFQPSTMTGIVNVAMSDVGEIVFLPRLFDALREHAPQASIRSTNIPHQAIEEALESGHVDLAIGYFPDLERANILKRLLFRHHFICLLSLHHRLATESRLTLEQFMGLEHAVVRAPGRSQEIFEQYLKDQRIERHVRIVTPHFMSVPAIVARSDLVVTVPHAMGMLFGKPEHGLVAVDLPFESPPIDLHQYWHRKYDKSARLTWLRMLVSQLFNAEKDEWKGHGSASIAAT